MAKKSSDITKTGPLNYRDLRTLNALNQMTGSPLVPITAEDVDQYLYDRGIPDETAGIVGATAGLNQMQDIPISTSIVQNSEGEDFWGNSYFDPDFAIGGFDIDRLQDLRAENQPWYSKLVNGVGKGGVLAVTTALETAGLLYGLGQGTYNAFNAEDGKGGEAFLHGLWDNPITNALQAVNEYSEEIMPNYYTQDEIENPFSNIFTANFLGDKLIKNLGFMVGAYYGGIPASKLVGMAGKAGVRSARAAALAKRAGMARAGMTEAEQAQVMLDGLNKVKNVARTTRATSQTLGALGSAVNEGAIEAINNSKDWANQQRMIANDEYQQKLAEVEEAYGGTEMELPLKMQLAEEHEKKMQEIELGRARMGNADLLLNIPVLMASNMYQLGRLYSRGFDSTRRQLGSFWNGHKLSGSLEKGTLASNKTWKGGLATAIAKSNTEGLEEYLQRAASDGAGEAVAESINRFMEAGTGEHAEEDVQDYIAGFGKAIADNIGDPNAWEEYMIGAVSSMVGMPVFGSQTKNAYIGKNAGFGFAGGIVGNYQEYMQAKEHEEQIAQYLNQRVKDPKFKALYDNLKKQDDYDKWLQEELEKGDKSKYKDLELEKFYQDLNAAASSGHLEEFKQFVGYNKEYTDDELDDIVKETSRKITADDQRKQDEQRKAYIEGEIQTLNNTPIRTADMYEELYAYQDELMSINQRLQDDADGTHPYEDKLEGPFIDVNGQMNATDPDKMREVLTRNRERLLQGIDDYLKIRNDIDIETDGRLDDNQIALLTQMKGKILDYEYRSANMADDLVSNMDKVKERQEWWQEKVKDDVSQAQEEYDNAKTHWETVQKGKHSNEYKQQIEKEYLAAEKKLNKARAAQNGLNNVMKLLDMILEEKDTTAAERAAYANGIGEGVLGRVTARMNRGQTRAINSDEAQAIVANPMNAMSLISIINNRTSGLDENTRRRLTQEVVDLNALANQKVAYNNKVREFLGDPNKINEAYQEAKDKITQKDIDNKSDDLSLRIKEAGSMAELDQIMRESSQMNSDVAREGLRKAKETADESIKEFIDDYEKGVNFYGNFAQQAQKLQPEVAAGVMETAASAWDYALTNPNESVYDSFVGAMREAAEDLEKDVNPASKETAAGIRKVLRDLDAGSKSVATNKNTKKGTTSKKKSSGGEEGDSDEASGLSALAALKKKKEEETTKPKAEPEGDTEEDIENAIIKEIRDSKQKDGTYKVNDVNKLSSELLERIKKFNEQNPDKQFLFSIAAELQKVVDEDIANDSSNLSEDDIKKGDNTEIGDEDDGSNRAERMRDNLRVSFKSDHPTEFRYMLDYKLPYDPESEQLKAVQQLLEQCKAYQFVDKNYLGYVAKESGGHPTIHFLKSTDADIDGNGSSESIIFMAIKWNKNAEDAIRKNAFNNKQDVNLQDEVKPVTINGEYYQIVGVMTINADIAPEVSGAFAALQGAINSELNPQMEQARQNGDEFVVSQLTTAIDQIYTGRLEKRTDEKDSGSKVSLYDFVATPQKEGNRASTEWDSGMEFYFETIVNGYWNGTDNDEVLSQMEQPNERWMEKNNGAIVMFVPKPDGKLYPVRCTRRTVDDWLGSYADSDRKGADLLAALLDPEGTMKNEYLGNIINYLKTLFDTEAAIGDKMNAKVMLSKYFIFGKQSPIHFNADEVSLILDGNTYQLDAPTVEEKIQQFFNALANEKILFTLPSESIEPISGREVIKSGIFEIGLRGFYNFNANFTVYPIDATGNLITIDNTNDTGTHFAGGMNIRATERNYDLGDGMKKYMLEPDGTFTLNGEPVSQDKQNLLTLAEQAQQGNLPSFVQENLSVRYKNSPEIRKFVANGITGFEGIYLIRNNGEEWIYDSRKGNHDVRLYRMNSEEGKKLNNALNQAIQEFSEKHMDEIKKLKDASKNEAPEATAVPKGSTVSAPNGNNKPKGSGQNGGQVATQFVGKTLDDFDMKDGGLSAVLAGNKTSPVVKKVFAALQDAEQMGVPFNPDDIVAKINGILAADKSEKRQMLDDLLNELKGCNRH